MNEEERIKILSNDFADFIVEYSQLEDRLAIYKNDTINYINNKYAVVYFDAKRIRPDINAFGFYANIPKLFVLNDTTTLDVMGVTRVQGSSSINLKGQDVLLGFVDTGIEYTNPIFKNADNTTRIVSIWDQTIENLQAPEDIFYYGTEYTRDQINEALKSDDPLSVVPSTDENGHGTMLAGLAGGGVDENNDFSGVAPLSELIIVKLKPAKQKIKEFMAVMTDTLCFQENDILFGVNYLFKISEKEKKPIVICIGLGSNQGSHDGRGVLPEILTDISSRIGKVVVTSVGNEGNAGTHYYNKVDKSTRTDLVELNVGQGEKGFYMELWGYSGSSYSIDILSPSGEYIPPIPARIGENRVIKFMFDNTTVNIDFFVIESLTGDELILLRFFNPAPGIWRFKVYGSGALDLGFHIWLPNKGMITENTHFLRPDPEVTITMPGNALSPIAITAYNHKNGSLFLEAGRGYSRLNFIKPDVAAPGVDVYSPGLGNTYVSSTGTSVAAANAAGVSALLLEWGIVRKNYSYLNSTDIKKILIRGAERDKNNTYPNKEWGFGTINIYNALLALRGETTF